MSIKRVPTASLKENPENPRFISETKFEKLKTSLTEFPEMLKARPIVVDEDNVVLGGNMRLKAARAIGLKTVWIITATGLTEEQKRRFVIKDNVGYGDWDYNNLQEEYDRDILQAWGLTVWNAEAEPDYTLLEDKTEPDPEEDPEKQGNRKFIQVEFYEEDYEAAKDTIKELTEEDYYIGGLLKNAMLEKIGTTE